MRLDVEKEFDIGDEFFAEGEASLPPSTALVEMEQAFEATLDDPQAIRDLVREKYVPSAILAYVDLLESTDPKMRKSAADTIMEIADVKDSSKKSTQGHVMNFNLGGESQKLLIEALGVLSQGEIIQEAEIVGDENEQNKI